MKVVKLQERVIQIFQTLSQLYLSNNFLNAKAKNKDFICLKKRFRKMLQLRIDSGKVGSLRFPPLEHP